MSSGKPGPDDVATGVTEAEANEPPASDFWEAAFTDKQMMWGTEPTVSAVLAGDTFAKAGARDVLIPGVGYGRNASPFLERGMSVTGIEISETAISIARSQLGLDLPIVHGSVTDMPFDRRRYDGILQKRRGRGHVGRDGQCRIALTHAPNRDQTPRPVPPGARARQ